MKKYVLCAALSVSLLSTLPALAASGNFWGGVMQGAMDTQQQMNDDSRMRMERERFDRETQMEQQRQEQARIAAKAEAVRKEKGEKIKQALLEVIREHPEYDDKILRQRLTRAADDITRKAADDLAKSKIQKMPEPFEVLLAAHQRIQAEQQNERKERWSQVEKEAALASIKEKYVTYQKYPFMADALNLVIEDASRDKPKPIDDWKSVVAEAHLIVSQAHPEFFKEKPAPKTAKHNKPVKSTM